MALPEGTQALEVVETSLTTRKTGNAGAIFSNSANGAFLFTRIWGRAPGARCRYVFKMGARRSAGTSSRWTSSFFPRRRRHPRLVSDWSSGVCSSDLPSTVFVAHDEDRRRQAMDDAWAQYYGH